MENNTQLPTPLELGDDGTPEDGYAIQYSGVDIIRVVGLGEAGCLDSEDNPDQYAIYAAQVKNVAEQTISAVNNTYGNGLNPDAYEDVVKGLENAIENLIWLRCPGETIKRLQDLILKAKI